MCGTPKSFKVFNRQFVSLVLLRLLLTGQDNSTCKRKNTFIINLILYSYFMPVCSIVKTITLRCRGRPDALLHEAEDRVQYCIRPSKVPRGNSLTILQKGMK